VEALRKKQVILKLNLNDLPLDMGLRKKIYNYHPNNDRDKVQRAYL
jgi:hypothetical protein